MSDLLSCVPWASTGIGAGVGLIAGYLLGTYDTRRKAHHDHP